VPRGCPNDNVHGLLEFHSQQWTIKTYPDKRPQTAWGCKRIIDDDDDDDLPSGIFIFLTGTYW
jgi:hypothetical protein